MKTEKYELYHQSNIIQIGNLIDDMHSVHVHLILLQRRYYRIYRKYAALSRKQYLSSGWFRAKRHLSRVHKKIANRRRDWFFKLALRLVRKYDKIAIETLNLEGMKKLWGRKVSDIAFSEFSLILQWTCAKYGKVFAKSGQWQPKHLKLCYSSAR